ADPVPQKPKDSMGPRRSGGFDWSLVGLPALAVALFAVMVAYAFRPPKLERGSMDFARFGRLPVADQGRVKPIDSLARNYLQAISNREYVKLDDGKTLSAVEWMLDVISGSKRSEDMRVIRIDHPDLLKVFELEPRPGNWPYSVN